MSVVETVLLILATWFTLSVVLTVALLVWAKRQDDREARADVDAELRGLIEDHRT